MLTPFIKQPKPPFPYDRPLSHSQLSSFKWNKQQWYDTYVLELPRPTSPEMEFGSKVDKRIQKDPKFLPEIARYEHLQYELKAVWNDIPLIGYPDALDLNNLLLRDYKTGKTPWDKKRADETLQLTMYLFMIYMIHKIPPQKFKCYIDWMPTCVRNKKIQFVKPFKLQVFETKRTMKDILRFGQYILDTRKQMISYYENHL